MKKLFKLLAIAIFSWGALNVAATAQESSGFTVNTVEGTASSGNIADYDPSLITNCSALQYGPNDGALCTEAYDEIVNSEYTPGCQSDYSNKKCFEVTKDNFVSVKNLTDECDIVFNSHNFTSPYIANYQNCKAAKALLYIVTSSSDLNILNEAQTGPYDAVCNDQHGSDCNLLNKADFVSSKNLFLSCGDYDDYTQCSDALDLNYGVNDAVLYAEALAGTYDASCIANNGQACSALDKADYQIAKNLGVAAASAASDIQQQIANGGNVDGSDIQIVLAASESALDSDVDLTNSLHVEYLQNCFGSNPNAGKIESCSANVDGPTLNQFAVSQIASGSAGTITATLLQAAGVSSETASIAAGNTCGDGENQSCLLQVNSVLADGATFTGVEIESALASYFNSLVEEEDTQVADASTNAGCVSSSTTYTVPSPPAICASVNWNCTSNTAGISVTYDDNGKGNIIADTTTFVGGAYTVTARTNVGNATRTISGAVNVNQLSAAKAAGFVTGSQPAWWRNYNVIERARNRCVALGGSLTTYNELKTANDTYNIIGNGTRTIFADASGNATASTSGRQQCSESWPSGPNSLRWYTWARSQTCKGRAGFGRNFTYVCKDVPCS